MIEKALYREEIRDAYKDMPRLRIKDLCFGDIVNWTPAAYWYALWDHAAQRGIVELQRSEFPDSKHIYSTHSTIYLGNDLCYNVTTPRADYFFLSQAITNQKVFPICRYMPHYPVHTDERAFFYKGISRLYRSKYDYRQLVSILALELLDYPDAEYLPWLDPRRRTVCSPGVRMMWMMWYQGFAVPNGMQVPRPGGDLHVERTPPALFENDPTGGFRLIGVLEGGMS